MRRIASLALIGIVGLIGLAWALVAWNVEPSGGWHDETGAAVSSDIVRTFSGAGHCGWESATILRVDAGLLEGDPEGSDGVVFFVRDPQGVVSAGLLGEYAVLGEVPDGVIRSGLATDESELWFGRDGRTALMVNPAGVEVWPRAKGAVMCG